MSKYRRALKMLVDEFSQVEGILPAIQVDRELHEEINAGLNSLTDNNGGPLLLVRPPRENEGMDASISVYETLHNPRERKIGWGPFSFIENNAHTHTHEIWYHNAQMQFFLRPQTRVDANKVRRQVRSSYPNVDITEANNRFPSIDVGEYVSVAELSLKRDFYYPIKAKLHNDDDFELDPYGDITSDMVVEEDETSDGQIVEAKDCKLMVQTVFEAARDVWNKTRPFGMDVNDVAQGLKEGEVHGNVISGYDKRSPSTLQNKTAKILETLQGTKGYYITMRIIAISPYKEIAQRRCRNVSYDFETYYNSITQQGLEPVELSEEEMRESLLEATRREHNLGFRDRFMANGKFLQPVDALGAIAHIPNDDINTPVVDWAKQDTGPGTPSGGDQLEDQKRESQKEGESGVVGVMNTSPTPGQDAPSNESSEKSGEQELAEFDPEIDNSPETSDEGTATASDDAREGWQIEDESSTEIRSEGSDTQRTPTNDSATNDNSVDHTDTEQSSPSIDAWSSSEEADTTTRQTDGRIETDTEVGTEDSPEEVEEESGDSTPAFASGNEYDGWGDESDSDDKSRGW